jgi:hypothetical protein
MHMKTSWFQVAAVAGVLVASGASAQESGDAHKAMHDAMHEQASGPTRPAAMPDQAMKPGMGHDQMHGAAAAPGQAMKPGPGKAQLHGAAEAAGQSARHQAMHQGTKDATATHADAANRAGMNAATSGSAMGGHGDMHDAANKEKMKEMHGGMMGSGSGGMMPSGSPGGPGPMTPGTGTTGGMTPGTGTPTTTPPPAGMPTTGAKHP